MLAKLSAPAPDTPPTPLAEVITRALLVADAEEAPVACLERMRHAGIRHLPVFTSGRLLGLVTMRDLLLADLEEKGQEVRLMRAYITLPPPEE